MNRLLGKVRSGERLSGPEAVELYGWDLPWLGAAGDVRRRLAVPHERVGFIVDRIVNYSNRCEARCDFCAFHAEAGWVPAYDLGRDEILAKIAALAAAGGTQVMLQGGLHPQHDLAWYCQLLRAVRDAFPALHLHCFSPAEVVHLAAREGLSCTATIGHLKAAGLDSLPGASDLLVEAMRRRLSPRKCTREQWREVMHGVQENGLTSTATMTYGMGETIAERVEHLCFVRQVQDETGILRAFIPWSFMPPNTRLADLPAAGGADYLRVVAVSRIVLDNVVNLQAGWLTEGPELAQLALGMGANDMGGVLTEEMVVRAAGVQTRLGAGDLAELIRNAGKVPVRRNSRYEELERV